MNNVSTLDQIQRLQSVIFQRTNGILNGSTVARLTNPNEKQVQANNYARKTLDGFNPHIPLKGNYAKVSLPAAEGVKPITVLKFPLDKDVEKPTQTNILSTSPEVTVKTIFLFDEPSDSKPVSIDLLESLTQTFFSEPLPAPELSTPQSPRIPASSRPKKRTFAQTEINTTSPDKPMEPFGEASRGSRLQQINASKKQLITMQQTSSIDYTKSSRVNLNFLDLTTKNWIPRGQLLSPNHEIAVFIYNPNPHKIHVSSLIFQSNGTAIPTNGKESEVVEPGKTILLSSFLAQNEYESIVLSVCVNQVPFRPENKPNFTSLFASISTNTQGEATLRARD